MRPISLLYPQLNSRRGFLDLNGLWEFQHINPSSVSKNWIPGAPLPQAQQMPVPASYNDLTQDVTLRDHLGDVWYQRTFTVPHNLQGLRWDLRFDAVAHNADVWLDNNFLGSNTGGFLPFAFDVTPCLRPGETHRITVRVGNILNWQTFPPGEIRHPRDVHNYPPDYRWLETHFDFFNYAGIHRPVRLVFTPMQRIERIQCLTGISPARDWVDYNITTTTPAKVCVRLRDANGTTVATAQGSQGHITLRESRRWSPQDPHLYDLVVDLLDDNYQLLDTYTERVGIRTVGVRGGQLIINNEPIYLRGFGRHEDADVRGRGLDVVMLTKDHNLMAWIGANSYRTSHYPYSEEAMRMADERGILVINEVPAVGFNSWSHDPVIYQPDKANDNTLEAHLQCLEALIERDGNHPCVISWSVANEAATWEEAAVPYFEKIFAHVRRLDPTRPTMIVEAGRAISEPDRMPASRVAHLADIIGVNRYYGWYNDPGQIHLMRPQLERELKQWWELYHKPVLLAEYGADTIAGFHSDPPQMFTEEFQAALLAEYHAAIDLCPFVIGEHVWNFADFATKQAPGRAWGNRKGVFTRQRQPKSVAQLLRKRWHSAKRLEQGVFKHHELQILPVNPR